MPDSVNHVCVVGAGIGGLMSALALQRHGIRVTVFERDPAPPSNIPASDSMAWLRKGVPQSRHPHFFMGRLRLLLEDRYPDLVKEMFSRGVGENAFADYVHPTLASKVSARAIDQQLRSLNARRTTFEMILREYAGACAEIEIHDDAKVVGLAIDPAAVPCNVIGVDVERARVPQRHMSDAVIDASGRVGKLIAQLETNGVATQVDQRDSGIWYLTRHYRLSPGQEYPAAFGLPAAVYPDFIVGALPADNGSFTVTFQIYRQDARIARALREPAHFQATCMQTGVMRAWVNPQRSMPTSGVYGFGQMDSFWRSTVVDGVASVLNFFCVGDSGVRSNPKFGRGCTWTTIAAHHAADLLARNLTPSDRIRHYEQLLEDEFRADWHTMRRLDLSAQAGFEISSGRRRGTVTERLALRFQDIFNRALVIEPLLFRDVWAGYHGLRGMSDWMRSPRNWFRLLRAWTLGWRYRDLLNTQRERPTRAQLGGQ